jgi:hypothetical protein
VDINKIRDLVKEAQALHKEFQKGFLRVYSLSSSGDFGELREVLSELYGIIDKKFDVASQIGKASSLLGGDFEGFVKELQKNEHQMKFLLEELLLLVETPKMSFTEKAKINASLQRLLQFYRVYDYSITRAIQKLTGDIEGLIFISEEGKLPPANIADKIKKIENLDKKLELLISFIYYLYTRPSWVHKVEEALRDWHSKGLMWVEVRNVENNSGVEREHVAKILEGLTLIGVVEKRERGGEYVYKLRGFGEG